VHDHVGGGFHRYSVDARWHVPHFEKMAYDNAALLALYADAWALTGREDYARVARGALGWVAGVLTDPAGGFCAAQDADVGLGDDGDYFTWTAAEVRAAAGGDAEIAIAYYDVDDAGDVHGRPGRNVLHAPKTVAQQAGLLGLRPEELADALERIRGRLLAARRRRTAPEVDTTVFADLNGMMIDAHLTAWERLGDEAPRRAALAAADRLLDTHRDDRGAFAHYVEGARRRGVGRLADQAWMGRALLHAFAATGEARYLRAADRAARFIVDRLAAPGGGFLSAPPAEGDGPAAVTPTQRWDDAPARSPASVAAELLWSLAPITGNDAYAEAAREALAAFAGAEHADYGTFLGGYGLALDHLLGGPRTVTVVGSPEAAEPLAAAARRRYLPAGTVLVLDPRAGGHAAVIERLGYVASDASAAGTKAAAYVCRGAACLRPAQTPEQLARRLDELREAG
jgi:hypothetical protein